jgi:Na+/proline symporter
MRNILVFLPLILLGIAWLAGRARMTRALIAFAVWVLVCEAVIIASVIQFPPNPALVLLGFVMLLLSVPFAVTVGLTGWREKAPALAAFEAYQGLSPEHKQKLHTGARIAARFGVRHFAKHLRNKGYSNAADALHEAGRNI